MLKEKCCEGCGCGLPNPLFGDRICDRCRAKRIREKLLKQRDWCDPYISAQGESYAKPQAGSSGYTVVEVLPFLKGLPLCNLVMAYVHSLHPTCVRIVRGEETCDAWSGRVSVYVDEEDKVTHIKQEVTVLGGCGAEVRGCLQELRGEGEFTGLSNVFGDTERLRDADFS